jgi:hypothetical protein
MASVDLSNSILAALTEINGSIDYDEKMIVDEELTEKGYLILPLGCNPQVGTAAIIGSHVEINGLTKAVI